ncbi:hypothetical protein pb186bvf_017176 [Paramecium bursaria]
MVDQVLNNRQNLFFKIILVLQKLIIYNSDAQRCELTKVYNLPLFKQLIIKKVFLNIIGSLYKAENLQEEFNIVKLYYFTIMKLRVLVMKNRDKLIHFCFYEYNSKIQEYSDWGSANHTKFFFQIRRLTIFLTI